MVVFDFFASAFLGIFFSVAPKYLKDCTDGKMKSFIDRLFLVLTVSQALRLLSCAAVMAAGLLK